MELFCGQNTNISGSCDNLVFLLDCSGTQFTVFNDRAIMPTGTGDCTQGFAQQCNPNRPEALSLDIITKDPSCPGANDASIVAVTTGGVAPFLYEWNTGDTTESIIDLLPQVYSLTVTDSLECRSTISIGVNPVPSIQLEFIAETSCQDEQTGSAFVWVISGGQPPYRYEWDSSAADQIGQNAIRLAQGSYIVTVTDANDCFVMGQVEIENLANDSIQVFCAEVTNRSVIIGWTEDPTVYDYEVKIDGGEWRSPNQHLSYFLTGLFQDQVVTFEVRGLRECLPFPTGSVECFIFRHNAENSVFVPNVFSPNGDGINDEFIITTRDGVLLSELIVYERYGGVVFHATNINDPNNMLYWDGTKAGKELSPQVFPYTLLVQYPDGRQERLKGDVTVVK